MIGLEEATAMQEETVLTKTINGLNDVITWEGLSVSEAVDKVLNVIDENFHLVPKSEAEPAPENALEDGIYKLWTNVAN